MLKVECTKEGTLVKMGGSTIEVFIHALCAVSAIHKSLKDNLGPEIVEVFEKEVISEIEGKSESPIIKTASTVKTMDDVVEEFKKLREELEKK